MALKKHQRILVWACLAALALWVVAPLRFLLLPLIYYNTHIHELCHALASVATGGQVLFVKVFADGSGVTQSLGGSPLLVSSAGYVGSSIVGGILVFGSRTSESARRMLGVAAGFLALGMLFFVRGDVAGVLSGIGWTAALGFGAAFLKGDTAVFAAQFLGIQQCLTSAHAFLALLAASSTGAGHNDARNMEQFTGVSAMLWALAWLGFSLVAIFVGVRATWHNRAR